MTKKTNVLSKENPINVHASYYHILMIFLVAPTLKLLAIDATTPNIVVPTLLRVVAILLLYYANGAPTPNNTQQHATTDATCNIQQGCVRLHGV